MNFAQIASIALQYFVDYGSGKAIVTPEIKVDLNSLGLGVARIGLSITKSS